MANDDWDEALRQIEAARESGATELNLRFLSIRTLPDQISELTKLRRLVLKCGVLTDLTGLSKLTWLTGLLLEDMSVKDLAPVGQLTNLRNLDFSEMIVPDVSPIARLKNLISLGLWESRPEAGLAPVGTLTGLKRIDLDRAEIKDIAFVSNLTALERLDLTSSRVTDLRPILTLASNMRDARGGDLGLRLLFGDTPACQDPVIAAAADMRDRTEGLQALLAHLRTLPPWPEPLTNATPKAEGPSTPPLLPQVQVAQTQIAFLLEHAAVTGPSAATTASQIRFALCDVPATDGNKLPPVLRQMEDVATILDRLAQDLDRAAKPDDLLSRIAKLEAALADLTKKLAKAETAREAAEALAKADGFWRTYRTQLAKASATATVTAATAVIALGIPTTLHATLGADHPLVIGLFKVLSRAP